MKKIEKEGRMYMIDVKKVLTEKEKDLLLKFITSFKELVQQNKKLEEKNNLLLLQKLIEEGHNTKNKSCKKETGCKLCKR